MCQAIYQITRSVSQAEPKCKLGTTCSFSLKVKSQKNRSFSWFLGLKSSRKKEILLHLNFQHMISPPQNYWCGILVCAHILFVLKENPSRRVNLTPLSAHDWKTRTPSSWSKQCSTRFQISLWKVVIRNNFSKRVDALLLTSFINKNKC